jgi:thioredoxin 1
MYQWMRKNLILLGVGIVIAGMSFGAKWNNNPVANTPQDHTDTNIQRNEGMTMLTATKSQGIVHHATESNFNQVVLSSDVPVLVDFYADWCAPCRMVAPVLEELAKETPDARIVKVNVDHAPQLARRHGIESIPSLKVFKDGKIVGAHVGLANKAQLKTMLDI